MLLRLVVGQLPSVRQRVPRDYLRTAAELGVTNVTDVVVRLFGLEGTERGDELDMLCPDPDHNDSSPSASVNMVTGFWHCFSCGKGGDLIGLGRRALGRSPEAIEELLSPDSPEALIALLESRARKRPTLRRRELILPSPMVYPDEPLDELYERGFTAETLRRWDVRYVPSEVLEGQKGDFTIYSSIGIPIEDRRQRVLAWCYRRTANSGEWQPRYLYTGGSEGLIMNTWFGVQHHLKAKHIVVVEGALDAMWLDQAGIPALALLGSSMGSRKLMELRRYRSVTLLGDRDAGGTQMVARIGRAIGDLCPVRIGLYPKHTEATDPQELSPEQLASVVRRARPWAAWIAPGR